MKINFFNKSINNYLNKGLTPFRYDIKGNLAPLEHDTVLFRGIKKETVLSKTASKKIDKTSRPNHKVANKVYEESEEAFDQFRYTLNQLFNMPVIELGGVNYEERINIAIEENQNNPIVMILARRKTPNSIAEKMSSLKIKSAQEARERMRDIIGARIVLSGNSQKEGDYVISKIIEAIKANKLKIKEIKVHSQDDPKLQYVSNRKINSLLTTCNKKNEEIIYKNQPRDSGYLAVHLITGELQNGYKAEIQIMGLEVAKFKEIEDLCYKCHSGKLLHKKYKSLQKDFSPLAKNNKIMAQFLEYTKRAYANERLKTTHKKGMYEEFLSIPPDLNLIPKNLDFNEIAKRKKKIDSK